MKRNIIYSFFLFALISVTLIGCGKGESNDTSEPKEIQENNVNLTLGTASTSGVYYAMGGEIANILNNNIQVEDFNLSSIESGASVENIAKIDSGDFQLGMAQNTTAYNAVNGIEEFEGKEIENFGIVASLHPEALHVITLESTGINSIDELKDKKVAIGVPSSATNQASKMLLKSYGIEDEDYQAFEEDLDNAKDKLQNGTIDAVIYNVGIPSSALSELQATTGDVKLLGLNDEAIKNFTDNTPYISYMIDVEFYEWLEEPVQTIAALAVLLASTDQVDEDLGYEITKTLYEQVDQMVIPQAVFITKETALDGAKDLPIHSGAEKYFKEVGILD